MEFITKPKKKHIAEFPTLYVSKEYRRKGIARDLVERLILDIKTDFKHVLKIQLSVYEAQGAAIEFYKRLGFEVFGEFKKELYYNGKYYKQYAMELFL